MENTSFEDIKELFRQTSLQMQETDRKMQETDRKMQETDRKMQETDRKMQESDRKWEESMIKTDKILQELAESRKILDKKLNNLGINIGAATENYFQAAIGKKLRFAGIDFDEMLPNLKKQRRGKSCEFDIVLVNHTAVAIIETKHRIPAALPEVMATRKAAEFRTFFPIYKDCALYLGVAGDSLEDGVIDEARKYGVGVLWRDGDALEAMDVEVRAY
jgi:hypothetical protein